MTSRSPSPARAALAEAKAFLATYPDVQAIDIVLSDLHGVGRGKIIRRHELESLFTAGRGMPASLFAQDVSGHDIAGAIAVRADGGGDSRCPIRWAIRRRPGAGLSCYRWKRPTEAPARLTRAMRCWPRSTGRRAWA